MARPHDVVTCAGVDHRMWSYLVVWCPHQQAFKIHHHQHTETGSSIDPVDFVSRSANLGPFDRADEVLKILTEWLAIDHSDWSSSAAAGPPPGSPG